jgi:hypothetical protein
MKMKTQLAVSFLWLKILCKYVAEYFLAWLQCGEFMWASHVTWIKITAKQFLNRFSNFMQAEHDNVIETCLCGTAMAGGNVTQ